MITKQVFDAGDESFVIEGGMDAFCERCDQRLADPICVACYNDELVSWMHENIRSNEVIIYVMSRMARAFPIVSRNRDFCILCEKENAVQCGTCSMIEFLKILQELNLDASAKKFLCTFDNKAYDLNKYNMEDIKNNR
jgi:hypothetical protein